jgi:hypothetical protein
MPTDIYIQYHYTYLITNTTNQMKYIGVRSCSCLPENDSDYMGSSKALDESMNETPESFTKTIIGTFPTRENANADEQRLHEMYDVARNPEFYNQMNAPLGFDNTGKHHSEETRKKISLSNSGNVSWNKGLKTSDATKKKLSEANRGEKHHFYGKSLSEEHKKKICENHIGMRGKKHSEKTREKISEANKGEKHYNYGKHHSNETRKKMSGAQKGIPKSKIICPHCSKLGGSSAMKRWHFDNCKKVTQCVTFLL